MSWRICWIQSIGGKKISRNGAKYKTNVRDERRTSYTNISDLSAARPWSLDGRIALWEIKGR